MPSRTAVPLQAESFTFQGHGSGRHQIDVLAGCAVAQLFAKPPRQIARMPRLPKLVHFHIAYSLMPQDLHDLDASGGGSDSREFPLSKNTYRETLIEITAKSLDARACIFENGI